MLFLRHCHNVALRKIYRYAFFGNCYLIVNVRNVLLSDVLFLVFQVIGKARVPIIKFVEKRSGFSFDIRFIYLPFTSVAFEANNQKFDVCLRD